MQPTLIAIGQENVHEALCGFRQLLYYNNMKEINEFYDLLSRINLMNNLMMKHILEFHDLSKKGIQIYSISFNQKNIDFVSEIKKYIENYDVCRYEINKLFYFISYCQIDKKF